MIFWYSIVAVEKKFIIFGGKSSVYDGLQSTIARFDPIENSWTKLGDLKGARYGQGVIQIDNEFIVVGGHGYGTWDEPTESCKLNGQLMICTIREPYLEDFSLYPELMLIPYNH